MKLNKIAAKVKKNLSKFVIHHHNSSKMGDARSQKEAFEAESESAIRVRLILERFHFTCRGCQSKIEFAFDSWDQHIEKWLSGAKIIPPVSQISMLECLKCHETTCAGCGGQPNIDRSNTLWTPLGVVNHCCEGGRVFGIWLLLCRFDKEASNQVLPPQSSPTQKSKKEVSKGPGKLGVGYTVHQNYVSSPGLVDDDLDSVLDEVEYGGLFPRLLATTLPHLPEVDPLDRLLTKTLQMLLGFLQSPNPDDTIALFNLSLLPEWINDLARTDSINDMIERQSLYNSMFDFVRLVANGDLVSLVLESRDVTPEAGLHAFNTKDRPLGKLGSTQNSSSWITCCKNTYNQAKVFLNLASKSQKPSNSKDKANSDATELCKAVIDLYESIQGKQNTDLKGIDTWENYWEENKLEFSPDVLKDHQLYQPEAIISSTPARGRTNTINKELANLQTSLPSGIFLRVDESRTDVMKVLMVGVEGSPYAGGLFPFDLVLDQNYPVTPPKMKFVLENVDEDRVPLNPNLHVGGNVCLSLLNTWSGNADEVWQPNKSTILSVLVSVQAMILGAQVPYINEPGLSMMDSAPAAAAYTLTVQCKTVKYGMIQWLKKLETLNPLAPDIWKDVSAAYWKYNGESVLESVKQWGKSNERLSDYKQDPRDHPLHANLGGNKKKKSRGKNKEVGGENLLLTLETLISPESITSPEPLSDRKSKHSSEDVEDQAGSKRQKLTHNQKMVDKAQRWHYNGAHKMGVIRTACDALGVIPSNSIQKSIDRMEEEINDEGKTDSVAAREWGVMKDV